MNHTTASLRHTLLFSFILGLAPSMTIGQNFQGYEYLMDSLNVTLDDNYDEHSFDSYVANYQLHSDSPDSSIYYLSHALKKAIDSENKLNVFYSCGKLAPLYFMRQDLSKGLYITDFCKTIEPEAYITEDLVNCLRFRAYYEMVQDKNEEALNTIEISLKYAESINDTTGIIDAYGCRGSIYMSSNNYDKSIEASIQSKEKSLFYNDSLGAAIALINIGTILGNINDYEQSISYAKEAGLHLPDDRSAYHPRTKESYQSTVELIQGIAHFYLGQYDQSISILEKASALATTSGESRAIFNAYYYQGLCYFITKNYDQAEEAILQAFDQEFAELESSKFRLHTLMSNIKFINKNCAQAEYHLNEAEKHQNSEVDLYDLTYFNQAKLRQIACSGNTESLEFHLDNYTLISDSLYYKRRENQARLSERDYKIKSIQDSLSIMNLTADIQEAKLRDSRSYLIIGGLTIALGAVALSFLYYRNETNKKEILESERKLNFYSNVAHELQTPLSIISGATKQLRSRFEFNEDSLNYLSTINRNTESLLSKTNQILSLTNLDLADDHKIVQNTFSLYHFLHFVLDDFNLILINKNIDSIIDSSINQDIMIVSDVEKLTVVVKNLLSNAFKSVEPYTGQIKLSYNSTPSHHELAVIDNGKGIAEKDLPHIFGRFYQIKEGSYNEGFGIGLSICKQYIEDLGGTLTVVSTKGLGSIFTISIAKVSDTGISEFQFPESISTDKINKLNHLEGPPTERTAEVLIVEDNIEVCQLIKDILTTEYHLKFIYNGKEAIEYLRDHKPEIIIVDWMIPDIDGLQIVKHVRNCHDMKSIPILMLTARKFLTDRIKALRTGVDDYLHKPFDENELKLRISKLLEAKENRTEGLIIAPKEDEFGSIVNLSTNQQLWLIELEEQITPLLSEPDLDMQDIAELTNYSLSKVSRKIKQLTGFTGKKYIRELRLWKARHLLETKHYQTVKEVSYAVGFKNQKYFSRLFKERFGKYPSEMSS